MIPHGHKVFANMCILRNGNQYLLLNRNKPPFVGHYVPVGGKLEPHETPKDGVLREVWEETGLKLNDAKLCGTLVETSPIKYNWICFIYLADIAYMPPPPCDEGTLEWIHHDDILKVPTPPTDWWIYNYIINNKPFVFEAIYDENLKMTKMSEELSGEVVFGG